MALSADGYARVIKLLFPPGKLWDFDEGSDTSNLVDAMAQEPARISQRMDDLTLESCPLTATETLPDWERMLGLPDEEVPTISADVPTRRLAIAQKLTRIGAQTPAFFELLAAACGYLATVTDGYSSHVTRSGVARSGDFLMGIAWAYTWRMDVSAPTGTALSHSELEAVIRKAMPSHTTVIFNYL
jgi:uncharacterized protein YmfQ (DUF2313 family)